MRFHQYKSYENVDAKYDITSKAEGVEKTLKLGKAVEVLGKSAGWAEQKMRRGLAVALVTGSCEWMNANV